MFNLIGILAVVAILAVIGLVAVKPFTPNCPSRRAGTTTTTLIGSLPPGIENQLQSCG